VFMIRCSC